jgi:hypothetical protein
MLENTLAYAPTLSFVKPDGRADAEEASLIPIYTAMLLSRVEFIAEHDRVDDVALLCVPAINADVVSMFWYCTIRDMT